MGRAVITLFLCGDVMTGRGIDQILAHPSAPGIQEPYVWDARDYVALAEETNGPIPRPVPPEYIWGDALEELEHVAPDARIINLETSVTASNDFWPDKGIHYRMHPQNIDCLTAARVDVCVLANNHVLDYGRSGLDETLATLTTAGVKVAGAGASLDSARDPATVDLGSGRRLLVFAVGAENSGIPKTWAATTTSPGVDLLPDLSDVTADDLVSRVHTRKRRGDVAVVSIHWGDNWGYEVPDAHVRFAHRLLDGGVDLIHGHSSHHPRPVEIYNDRLVLYGCGDFITDYEGIPGYEGFRDDLVLMYFLRINPDTGELDALYLTPLQIRKMQLVRPAAEDRKWLRQRLASVSRDFGCDVTLTADESTLVCSRWCRRGPRASSPWSGGRFSGPCAVCVWCSALQH
jgi:poly-gamma-glutamate capsule biosynthesis protein CapA/YwtB (metallophosphatase superfamily)